MNKYTIYNTDSSIRDSIDRAEFYEVLAQGNHYHYKDGGVHVLLSMKDENGNMDEKNKEISLIPKREEQAEVMRIHRMTRCLDEKGNICKGNCSGVIKKKGKIEGFKGECPKNAERPNRTPVSLDERIENGQDEPDQTVSFEIAIEQADVVDAFRKKLTQVDPTLLPLCDAFLGGESVKEQAERLSTISSELTYAAAYAQIKRRFDRIEKESVNFQKESSQNDRVTS